MRQKKCHDLKFRSSFEFVVWRLALYELSDPSDHVKYFDYCRSEYEAGYRQKSAEREHSSGQGERLTCEPAKYCLIRYS